jgi:hypothetical protein
LIHIDELGFLCLKPLVLVIGSPCRACHIKWVQ